MKGFMDDMYAAMSSTFTDLWGGGYQITLVDGGVLDVEGIFKMSSREETIGDYGVTQLIDEPRLDVRREQLIAQGVDDPETDLHDATVEVDGTIYRVSKVRDDRKVMVKLWLSFSVRVTST